MRHLGSIPQLFLEICDQNLTSADFFFIVEEITGGGPSETLVRRSGRLMHTARKDAILPGEHNESPSAQAADATVTWLLIVAGLVTALVAGFVLRPAWFVRHSFSKALLDAAVWITVTAIAGTAAVAIPAMLLRRKPGRAAVRPALDAAAGWIFIPPVLLLTFWRSPWSVMLIACAAAALAVAARELHPAAQPGDSHMGEPPLAAMPFAELPAPDSQPRQSFIISGCAQGAIVCLVRRSLLPAAALLGAAAFLLAWKIVSSPTATRREGNTGPAVRATVAALLAILILVPLLLARPGQGFAPNAGGNSDKESASSRRPANTGQDDAYQGIILFTVAQKEAVAPPSPHRDPFRPGTARPLIIPFDGSYWYFQAPRHGPGLHAHLAHGDPVAVSIFSTGWIPLAMQAHQSLARPVDLACCGQMEVTVENGDNRAGRIDLAVLLTDTSLPGKPSVYLGANPILSTEADHFFFKTSPVDEELTFTIPPHARINRFDEITVLFFPAEERSTLGAKVGIRQFELLPR